MLRQLLLTKATSTLLSVCSAQQSLDVLGILEAESETLILEIVRRSCYAGFRVDQIATSCRIQRSKLEGDGYVYFATSAYNEAPTGEGSEICLQCCNNLNIGVGERVDEVWHLECDVNSDALRSLQSGWYGYEFRFARNLNEDDSGVVRCAMGRLGCEYEDVDGLYAIQEKNLTCSSRMEDFATCSGTNSRNPSKCVCRIPGSQKGGEPGDSDGDPEEQYNDAVRQRRFADVTNGASCTWNGARQAEGEWYLKGYSLTVEVVEHSDNVGNYWRAVTDCRVEVEEVRNMSEGDTFYQRIRMLGPKRPPPYKWLNHEQGLPFVVCGAFAGIAAIYLGVRCCRDETCLTCGTKLVFSREQCCVCRFYRVEMPDPLLLARIRARAKPSRGFVTYTCRWLFEADPNSSVGRCLVFGRRCAIAICLFTSYAATFAYRLSRCIVLTPKILVAFISRCMGGDACATSSFLVPVCIVPGDGDINDNEASLPRSKHAPTLLYQVDPHLRRMNVFEKLTRHVDQHEHNVIVVAQFGLQNYSPRSPRQPSIDNFTSADRTDDAISEAGSDTLIHQAPTSSGDYDRNDDVSASYSLSARNDHYNENEF